MTINNGIRADWFELITSSVQKTPYYQLLGIELVELGPGRAVLQVIPGIQHTNPMALVHGGLIMSLGDAAMGNAIRSQGIKAVTVAMNIEFMRSAPLDVPLVARGEVIKSGNKLVFARAVMEEGDRLIAATTGTFSVTGQLE